MAKTPQSPGPLPEAPETAAPGTVARVIPEPPPPAFGGVYLYDPATGERTPLQEVSQ